MAHILSVWTDGGARGNPGPAGIGVVVVNGSGAKIYQFSGFIGHATNNIAEYRAVLQALDWLVRWKHSCPPSDLPESINIYLDSLLVVKQLGGEYRIKNNALRNLSDRIHQAEKQLGFPITYHHIPRAQNAQADALVNQALDAYQA